MSKVDYIRDFEFVSEHDNNSVIVNVSVDVSDQSYQAMIREIKEEIQLERQVVIQELEEYLGEDKFKVPVEHAERLDQFVQSFKSYSKDISYKFYQLYGKKLVHYEFANYEMFNKTFKGDDHPKFGLAGALMTIEPDSICRYGRLWSREAVALRDLTMGGLLEGLNFYLILCRERLFSIRSGFMFMDETLRLQYPYDYCYVGSLEDTTLLSLEYLTSRNPEVLQIESINRCCSLLNQKQSYYLDTKKFTDAGENLILPFQYFFVSQEDEISEVSLILLHISMKPQPTVKCYCQTNDINLQQVRKFMEEFTRQMFKLEVRVEIEETQIRSLKDGIVNLIDRIEKTIFFNKQAFSMEEISNYLKSNDSLCLLPQDLISNSKTQYKSFFRKFIPS